MSSVIVSLVAEKYSLPPKPAAPINRIYRGLRERNLITCEEQRPKAF